MNSKIDYVDIGDTKLRYLMFGEGEIPLVIIPGLSLVSVIETAEVLMDAFQDFTSRYTIYLIDRREDVPDDFTINDFALDELKAIKTLGLKGEKGIDKLYVFATSLGGMITLHMAFMQPNTINKAVIASSTCRLTDSLQNFANNLSDLADQGKKWELVKYMGDMVYTEEYMRENENAFRMFADSMTDANLEHFSKVCKSIKPFDLSSKMRRLPIELFVVGATKDALFGDEETKLIQSKTGCKSYIYQGSCHSFYDLEEDFRPMLLDFLNK